MSQRLGLLPVNGYYVNVRKQHHLWVVLLSVMEQERVTAYYDR